MALIENSMLSQWYLKEKLFILGMKNVSGSKNDNNTSISKYISYICINYIQIKIWRQWKNNEVARKGYSVECIKIINKWERCINSKFTYSKNS